MPDWGEAGDNGRLLLAARVFRLRGSDLRPSSLRRGLLRLGALLAPCLLLLPAPAPAQDLFAPAQQVPLTVPQSRDLYEVLIDHYDRDQNSRLSEKEFLALPTQLFLELDSDENDVLDSVEFAESMERAGEFVRLESVRLFDKDGDGELQAKEFRQLDGPVGRSGVRALLALYFGGEPPRKGKKGKSKPPSWRDVFEMLDIDGDGSVPIGEELPQRLDTLRRDTRFAGLIARAEQEGDGTLSEDGFLQLWRDRFALMDRDRDGGLSAVEIYSFATSGGKAKRSRFRPARR